MILLSTCVDQHLGNQFLLSEMGLCTQHYSCASCSLNRISNHKMNLAVPSFQSQIFLDPTVLFQAEELREPEGGWNLLKPEQEYNLTIFQYSKLFLIYTIWI